MADFYRNRKKLPLFHKLQSFETGSASPQSTHSQAFLIAMLDDCFGAKPEAHNRTCGLPLSADSSHSLRGSRRRKSTPNWSFAKIDRSGKSCPRAAILD